MTPRPDISAVLNVPDKAKVMAAVKESAAASLNQFARNLYAQRALEKLTSKLDLAEKRRRDRRLRMNGSNGSPHVEERQNHLPIGLLPNGNSIFASSISTGSSDSEQDWDSDGETGSWRQHLLLTKGPPCKLEASPQKLCFLQMFGLTTQATKNDLELAKCERRYLKYCKDFNSLPLESTEDETEEVVPLPPELPYPSGSPDSLNKSSDYNSKICFLRYLNLEPIPHMKRAEREALWQHVLSERVRRNSINSVVLYTSQQNQNKREAPKEAPVDPTPSAAAPKQQPPPPASPCAQLTVPRPCPPSPQGSSASIASVCIVNNGAVRSQAAKLPCLPPMAMRRASSSEDDEQPAKLPKWGGIEEVVEAYQRYVRETDVEMLVLREHCQRLHQQLMEGRQKAEQLDSRLRELVARKNMQDYERHQIQSALDQLNSCLRKLR